VTASSASATCVSQDHPDQRGGAEWHHLREAHRRSQEGRVALDRKVLADLAVRDAATFGRIAEVARGA
jgi:hypothetical protein